MIYKGCVVKIEEDFAVVMTNTMEYLKVVKKEGLKVGGQIMFVPEDLYQEKRRSHKAIASIAAVLIIMILSAALAGMLQIPGSVSSGAAAVISLDINPSMEFEVDHNRQIIKVVAFNKEAKKLLNKDVIGMNIGDALWLVIKNAKLFNYITDEKNAVLIGATILQEDFSVDIDGLENEVEEKWVQEYENVPLNLVYLETDKEDIKDARKEKISVGKYQVYKNSIEKDDSITTKNIKEMKVQDMVENKLLKLQEKGKKNNLKTIPNRQQDKLDQKEKQQEEKEERQEDKDKRVQEKLKEQNQTTTDEKKTNNGRSGEKTENKDDREKLTNDDQKKDQEEKKKDNQQEPVDKIEKDPGVEENGKDSKKEDSNSGKKTEKNQEEKQKNSGEEKKRGEDKKSD